MGQIVGTTRSCFGFFRQQGRLTRERSHLNKNEHVTCVTSRDSRDFEIKIGRRRTLLLLPNGKNGNRMETRALSSRALREERIPRFVCKGLQSYSIHSSPNQNTTIQPPMLNLERGIVPEMQQSSQKPNILVPIV